MHSVYTVQEIVHVWACIAQLVSCVRLFIPKGEGISYTGCCVNRDQLGLCSTCNEYLIAMMSIYNILKKCTVMSLISIYITAGMLLCRRMLLDNLIEIDICCLTLDMCCMHKNRGVDRIKYMHHIVGLDIGVYHYYSSILPPRKLFFKRSQNWWVQELYTSYR